MGNRSTRRQTGRLRVVVALAALWGMVAFAPAAIAAPGGLDGTFGSGGVVTTAVATAMAPTDAAVQPDGKILVLVGISDPNGIATTAYGVLRYRGDGTLDPTFGTAGVVKVAFTNFINTPHALVLQPDGKIVVAGETSASGTLSEFFLVRLTSTGALDGTFGSGGKVTTNFVGQQAGGVSNPATVVLLQPDGKIVAGGVASQCAKCPHQTALARYNPNGSLDTTFGAGGTSTANLGIGSPSALGEDAAGDIVTTSGGVNVEFSAAGVAQPHVTPAPITVATHPGFQINPTVYRADGDYLFATTFAEGLRDIDAQVHRRTPNGGDDSTFTNPPFDFSDEGTVATESPQAIGLAQDGRVLVAGIHTGAAGTTGHIAVARLNSNGSLDTTFGAGGAVTTAVAGQGSVTLVQPDGKILVIGQGTSTDTADPFPVVLLRFLDQ